MKYEEIRRWENEWDGRDSDLTRVMSVYVVCVCIGETDYYANRGKECSIPYRGTRIIYTIKH